MLATDFTIPASLRLGKGDALLIVPPFAMPSQPYFGVHMLQSCARIQGYEVNIFYANFLLATLIGMKNYEAISGFRGTDQIGERFFASAAYNLPPFGSDGFIDSDRTELFVSKCCEKNSNFNILEIKVQERKAAIWADAVANLISVHDFKVVGCSTTFEQTASSIALLNRVKQLRPDIVTIIGGANCEGIMAKGILSLSNSVDYIFSGECEVTFPDFLAKVREGRMPTERIVRGRSCIEIEDLPLPDYSEFYHQHNQLLSGVAEEIRRLLPYQSSKGCWWGEKHQCSFCGLNGENIGYRYKSAEKVFADLKRLRETYPDNLIAMTDNVLPSKYFESLIPRLEKELPNANLFYEVRPNLSLKKLAALKRAGFNSVQAGIESLSTPSLKLIRKGVTSRRNLAFLRYARSVDLPVIWNMMVGIPGEQLEDLKRLLSLIPLLRHLHPPDFTGVLIERFSPYFLNPEEYGLTNITPWDSYYAFLPEDADIENVAYHFKADYRSASRDHPEVTEHLKKEIDIWHNLWRPDRVSPTLMVESTGDGKFMILDTRGLPGTVPIGIISRDEAKVALSEVVPNHEELLKWAIERKLAVEMDSIIVPLATGSPDLISEFEEENKSAAIC
jgi:ribosomal peptide maturation radical SAM protein 1